MICYARVSTPDQNPTAPTDALTAAGCRRHIGSTAHLEPVVKRRRFGQDMTVSEEAHYRRPGWLTQHVFNPIVAALTRAGISIWGSRVLEVAGRRTGQPRRVPVNVLTFEASQYLVAARGEAEWVRNVRAADGQIDLILGRKRQHRQAREVRDDEKVRILRAYLKRWKAEVGSFFDGVGPDSTDGEIRAIAHKHPVFVLDPV
jgi:deazaflavin-dependent oxidoreductase (nitroreductase family)